MAAVAQTVGSLLLVSLLLFSPTAVLGDESDDYRRRLEEAYNSTGIPWDQVLVDSLEDVSLNIEFDCDTDIEANATNVNMLTPADIKVVGALGDSITAAFAAEAKTIVTLFTEYRGVSWSIGGDGDLLAGYTTLPNIIKQYNPNVRGYSVKTGKQTSQNAHNNVAVSGAKAVNMPSQARNLVDKITSDPDIDVDNDWKLVTLWIGGNDLCAYCKGKEEQFPENYGAYIREALEILKEMPRTFVNLVKILDVTKLESVREDALLCTAAHLVACSCSLTEKDKEVTREGQKLYNEELQKIVDDDEFHTDNFTVVLQPFMENINIPRKDNDKVDMSYFAIDCFHFRTKGHRVAAGALWSNMMEPVGQKTDDWEIDPNMKLKCPPEGAPYFYTKKNSLLFSSFGAVPSGADTQGGAQTGSANLLTILLGTGVTILVVVVVTVGGVVSAVLYKRRQHRRRNLTPGTVVCDTERVYLIKKK